MRAADSDGVLRESLRQLQGVSSSESWTQEQWCEAFSFLFLAPPGDRHAVLEHQDDMLWFVTAPEALGPDTPPVTLRRNTSAELPPELRPGGGGFASVDWGSSVQLNLVVQAQYILTVVKCGQDVLPAVAQGHATSGRYSPGTHPSAQHVPNTAVSRRRVYASPMAADVNLEEAKSGRPPQPCYPDVCFAVDNYEDAFQDVILAAFEDCYCVMLHVHSSGRAGTAPGGNPGTSSPSGPVPQDDGVASQLPASNSTLPPPQPPTADQRARRAVLFSAYVTRDQVAAYIANRAAGHPKPSLLNRLLGQTRSASSDAAGRSKSRRDKVVMIGPGAVGRAEVLAAAAGSTAGVDASSGAGAHGTPLHLSLMWMSLPVQALAQAVLRFASGDQE